jgi:hypothetical protein
MYNKLIVFYIELQSVECAYKKGGVHIVPSWIGLKMVMRPETEVFDLFFIKLAGGRVAIEVLHQELKLAAKCLKSIELESGPGGYIGIPIVLLMVLEINCNNRPHCCKFHPPRASKFNAILR